MAEVAAGSGEEVEGFGSMATARTPSEMAARSPRGSGEMSGWIGPPRGLPAFESNHRVRAASSVEGDQRIASPNTRPGTRVEPAIATQKRPRAQPVTFVHDQLAPATRQRQA